MVLVCYTPLLAQTSTYDPDWYIAGQPHLKLSVAEDGIYRIDGSDLAGAGVLIGSIDPTTIRILENGQEIPVWHRGGGTQIDPSDSFLFVGRKNTGADEAWVYNYDETLRSSANRSFFTDTTSYFMTWGGAPGLRYSQEATDAVSGPVVDRARVQGWLETDLVYFFGAPQSSGNPLYTAGEGYYMTYLAHGQTILKASYAVGMSDLTRSDADSVKVSVRLQGGTGVPHLGFVDIRVEDPITTTVTETSLDSVSWSSYRSATLSASVAQTEIPGDGKTLRLKVGSDNSAGALPNAIYIDYVAYSYVRALNPESGQFHFDSESSGAATFQLAGSTGTDVVVLEPASGARFDVKSNESFGDQTQPGREYWLTRSGDEKKPVISMARASDVAGTSYDADYVIIAAPGLMDSAQKLAQYRSSPAGGSYRALVFNVLDIYDQFDYGRPTPIAIRRFVDHMHSWQGPPDFLTIWGDALYPDSRRQRFDWEVPSFGNASSDSWFAMQSNGQLNDYTEWLAVGRITARSNERGSAFVDKIRNYELRPPSDWQKRAIMMSGGANESEQFSLKSATRNWGSQIAAPPFGGDVTYFHKTSEAALDPTFLDSVDAAITEGSGWLGFFGHSAADTWEIVTESPVVFGNSERLPVVVSLGCFTGAYARGDGSSFDQPPFAELLVTESQNGAIAHYGGSTSSFISVARQIADPFYDLVFNQGARTLGEAVIESKKRYLGNSSNSTRIETVLQYNLIGDPATHVSLPSLPDFHVEQRSVDVAPAGPVAGIDSTMTVNILIENRGLVPQDSLTVRLVRTSPGGASSTYRTRIATFPLSKSVSFELPVEESDIGENRLAVSVDADHEYEETSEEDNSVEIIQFVFASGVVQLFPPDYGLVTSRRPTLRYGKAAASEDFVPISLELDTTDSFDSGLLVNESLQARALSEWTPLSPLIQGETYRWRIAVDSDDLPKWRTRSFSVRDDLPFDGWFQQGAQFVQNDHGPFLTYSGSAWRLRNFAIDVRIRSAQFRASALNTIIVGGFEHETLEVGFGVVIVSVNGIFKASDSFVPYPNVYGPDELEERQKMKDFIATAKEHEYVFVNSRFLRIAPGVVEMPEETKAIFRALGSTQIDSVDLNDLWNFAVRIGDDTPLVDEWADRDPNVGPHVLWSDLSIPVRFASGSSQSPLIGPATSWHEIQFTGVVNNERSSIETSVLSPNGDTLGSQTLLTPGGTGRIDLSPSGLNVDARQYPFLRLAVNLSDSTRLDTPQLLNWYAGYDPVSELLVDAPAFKEPIDTLAEGQPLNVSVNVINGGPGMVDSVFVEYTITDRNNRSTPGAVDTLLGIEAGASVEAKASISTTGKVGDNQVAVTARQTRGPEPATFNNKAIGSFRVRGDDTPPVFSLTVDGATYPNDPRVITTTDDASLPFFSSHPVFEIVVTDDNQFASLVDSTTINLSLDNTRVAYSRSDVQFIPASPSNNEARLIFSPDFSGQDTTHTMKVWAQDASGNSDPTKEEPYTLSFRVQDAAEIESIYPYPNPMHNFTTFMFRLRGADAGLVDDLRIRVYTISGRPVREFDLLNDPALLEDGGLRIGWNRLVWDGRDADGDLLATGVYLYKVFLRAEGRDISVNNDMGVEKIAIIR